MKKFKISTIATIAVCLMLAAALSSCNSSEPQIGDVWRYRPQDSRLDPFYDFKVIDVKNDYILYLNLSDSTKGSSTIRVFKLSAERLSSCR